MIAKKRLKMNAANRNRKEQPQRLNWMHKQKVHSVSQHF